MFLNNKDMKIKSFCKFLLMGSIAYLAASCTGDVESKQVLLTSESGDVLKEQANVVFRKGQASEGAVLTVSIDLKDKRQQINGIGTSLTESSAFVLACLPVEKRRELLQEIFGENGADFALVRTHIGPSDFSVEGKYSLAEVEGDTLLEHFSLNRDKEGFDKEKYPHVVDAGYDLYPLMKEVAAIRKSQSDNEYRIVASAWTAPAWMKDNKSYYQNGYGGTLLKEYYRVYADYLVKYLETYKQEGIEFWGITPVNEPQGNGGQWESMHFTPGDQAGFIGKYMGPALEKSGFGNLKLLAFDQNTREMPEWAHVIYADPEAAKYTAGMAVHWYASTFHPFGNIMDSIHNAHPDKIIMHTEGCIDALGTPSWCGDGGCASDPEGFVESGWFKNDAFWWNCNATDWAYSIPCSYCDNPNHPKYVPTHRYARYIIEGINHRLTGFIDWNIILDSKGGPNHANNFCGAPVMIDTENKEIYFTPAYHVLKQLSRNIRPGDVALHAVTGEGANKDNLFVGATLNQKGEVVVNMLNIIKEPITFDLKLGEYTATVTAPANSLQTIIVKLP